MSCPFNRAEGFQKQFCQTWLDNYLCPVVTQELDSLFSYTEPLVPHWFCNVREDDVTVLRKLRDQYVPFGAVMMLFHRVVHFGLDHKTGGAYPPLPIRTSWEKCQSLLAISSATDPCNPPNELLDAVGYADFLDCALAYGKKAISEFKAVKNRNGL
jgi:hypothetical protein